MKLVITRPKLDAGPLAEKLRAMGHEPVVAPVLEIVARENVAVPGLPYQAIAVTSANAMRCFAGKIDQDLPVFAVGAQSAASASARGFKNISSEGGDVGGLARVIENELKPDRGPLLYLSGAEVSGDLKGELEAAGFSVKKVVTYDAVATDFAVLQTDITSADGVLLYSPRSAKLWLAAIEKIAPPQQICHFCLSQQVAKVLPNDVKVRIAQSPTEEAMLALLDLGGEAA